MTPEQAIDVATDLASSFRRRADQYDRGGSFPAADFADLRSCGLMGLMAPRELGGVGAGFPQYTEVATALAKGNGATALIYNMHASVTGALALAPAELVNAFGEEFAAARERVLKRTVDDAAFYAVAMSERGAGSRLSQIRTTYRNVNGGWRVTGSKTFCSGAGHADAYLVPARREPPGGDPVISYFLVPAGDGVTVEETWDSLGMRATASHDLHLDVVVPKDALLGAEGLVLPIAQTMPQWLVASYAAVYVGVARSAVDAAAQDVTARGLDRLPAVRARLGRADAHVAAAREVVREAARRVGADPGTPETNRWIWRAKLLAGDCAAEVAGSALEACGTSATRRGAALERIYRDARCGSLQPATSDVCADWLGDAVLGRDPEAGEVPRW